MSAVPTIHCPTLHINDVGDFYEGCGEEFQPHLTAGYATCPSCGLVFAPALVPFGVHWSGRPGDDIECSDVPFYDTEPDKIPKGYTETSDPIYDGDMAAAMAVAKFTACAWIAYIAKGTWADGVERDGVTEPRWTVSAFLTEEGASDWIKGAPEGSFCFNGRTHYAASDPFIEKPIGYLCAVENGKHLEGCGQCDNLLTRDDGDKRTGKYRTMCSACVMSEVA